MEAPEAEATIMEPAWVCAMPFAYLLWLSLGFHRTPNSRSGDVSDSSPCSWDAFHPTGLERQVHI